VLAPQRVDRPPGGREVQVGDDADQAPVRLLGERRGEVAGPQPRLQVHQGHPAPERDQPPDQGRGGVALHDHRGGAVGVEHPVQRRRQLGDQLGLRPGAAVEGERHVRRAAEGVQRLRQHRRVLTGRDEDRAHPAQVPQRRVERGHLDRLGPGADDEVHGGEGHGGGPRVGRRVSAGTRPRRGRR
jgi:hypothetical protein